MVIRVQIHNWNVKRVLVNLGSSTDLLYQEAFKGMNFDITELLPFKGSLVGFSGEPAQVLGHLSMVTTFGCVSWIDLLEWNLVTIKVSLNVKFAMLFIMAC